MIGFLYQDNKFSLFHYERNMSGRLTETAGQVSAWPGCARCSVAVMSRLVGLACTEALLAV